MKNFIFPLLIILGLIFAPIHVAIVSAAPASEDGILTLENLGLDADMVLRGPYDSRDIRFDLPATWALQDGARLELEITAFSAGSATQSGQEMLGAILEVSLNEQLLQSIPLVNGKKTLYEVVVPLESLVSPYEGGGHKLSFFLDAAVDCSVDFHDTTVMIDANSKVNFPHEQASLALDLQRLPWPVFLERGKIMEPAAVVLPQSPTAEELQAGFTAIGAFGRMTGGKLSMITVTEDQLTDDILKQFHLILVGKPASFPDFAKLKFPVITSGGKFTAVELKPEDGLLQMMVSPWNSSRIVLWVSGDTELAVVKAAQALSTGSFQTGKSTDYSIIATVNPYPVNDEKTPAVLSSSSENIKFSDLGYTFTEVSGIGTHWVSYEFMIPTGLEPSGEVYLEMNLSASNLVDPNRSEGVIYLNDVQIGSLTLTADGSNLATSKIYIPLSVVKPGLNRLDAVFNLLPLDECSLFSFADMWVTIFPDSTLHLPLDPVAKTSSSLTLRDLKAYPLPFTNDPSLGSTTFVLSRADPNSWIEAAKVAYDLGTRVTNPVIAYRVAYDGQIPEETKSNHLILVGEPKNLTILSDLKDALPAYFENSANQAVLESQQVIYRITPDKSLGYLQLFASPWNDQAAVLGIFGTTPDGLEFAINSLLDSIKRGTLSGNFATIDNGHATVVDTRTGLGIGRIAPSLGSAVSQEVNPVPAGLSTPATVTSMVSKQTTFIAIIVVLSLIAITLILIAVSGLRKGKS